MAKKHKANKSKKIRKKKKEKRLLPDPVKRWIFSLFMVLISLLLGLSFFHLAGKGGEYIFKGSYFSLGKSIFLLPLIFIIAAIYSLWGISSFRKKWPLLLLVILILIIGVSGMASSFNNEGKGGGILGYLITYPFLNFFNKVVSFLIFFVIFIIGILIIAHPLLEGLRLEKIKKRKISERVSPNKLPKQLPKIEIKKPLISKEKILFPKEKITKPVSIKIHKEKPVLEGKSSYQPPPFDLLEVDKGTPMTGDTKENALIIKKTLENFGIPVEMGEVNIGPTVTQYTLKPGEGIKLSKITSLSNNLSLALAAHPIRIEAPIPGKPLVGVEVPNRQRVKVGLRGLLENPIFQNNSSPLYFAVGRDVSGSPIYADLRKMPHLLVAGSTGSGKTVFLNNLILTLLYRNGPDTLKMILVDPKRVEFSVYNNLPHLLSPVILKPDKVTNALKWLVFEMDRRFDLLSRSKTRDIISYNAFRQKQKNKDDLESLPFIVLIIDELADLMASKGREIEAFIVRIAQMARAVGIHLVLATQRPSVEVITGLIKANITSRVAFQVASQIDSRTILDVGGAEKLLGGGDLLFVSAERVKPRRAQGPFVSEKEVKKVVDFVKSQSFTKGLEELELEEALKKSLKEETEEGKLFFEGEDPLYESAKEVVIRAKKASASLLQRRLRVGYARAARLLDMLEEKGIVGPSDGAKPREVYIEEEEHDMEKDDIEKDDIEKDDMEENGEEGDETEEDD